MRAHQAHYPVATQCRLLGVSTSGYYAWQRRGTSARAEADRELLAMIQAIHASSHGTYGAPRIHAELGARGVCVGRKRVARLMRSVALARVSRRKRPHTTVRSRGVAKAPDLVQRQFTAEAPDRLWVADITYVPTGAGFLYLAVVVDVFSRRVVGWAMESHIRTELVLQALNMALYLRRPQGVIHHSDQGIQYTAYAFGKRCREWGVRPSMGSVGDCYDNALCESFFASLECELLDRRSFQTHAEARMAVFQYIEGWYNTHRRHSSIGYYAPIAFERRYTSNIQHVEPLTVHQIGATPLIRAFDDLLDQYGNTGVRFERHCNRITEQLQSDSHSVYLEGLERVGELLGYSASRPENPGAPDAVWRGKFGSFGEVVTYEAKIEDSPSNEIVLSDLGQAHNQKTKADSYYGSRGFVVRGAIVTHLTELGAGVEDSLGDLRIVSKEAICDLWVKVRAALIIYRDMWLPNNLVANLQAAQSIKSRVPETGWLTRALSHGSAFVTSGDLLKEWGA